MFPFPFSFSVVSAKSTCPTIRGAISPEPYMDMRLAPLNIGFITMCGNAVTTPKALEL